MRPRLTWKVFALACGLVAVLGLCASAGLTYYVATHQDELIARLGTLTGHDLTVGELDLHWSARGPVITLRGVDVAAIDHSYEARVGHLVVRVDTARTLARGDLRIASIDADQVAVVLAPVPAATPKAEEPPSEPIDWESLGTQLAKLGELSVTHFRLDMDLPRLPQTIHVAQLTSDPRGSGRFKYKAAVDISPEPQPGATPIHTDGVVAFAKDGLHVTGVATVENLTLPFFYFPASDPRRTDSGPVSKATGNYEVTVTNDDWAVAFTDVSGNGPGFEATATIKLHSQTEGELPLYDVAVKGKAEGANDVFRALPSEIMGQEAYDWVATRIQGANVHAADLSLTGGGMTKDVLTLKLDAFVKSLRFVDEWPAATDIRGDVLVTIDSLTVDGHSGKFAGLPVEAARVTIPTFASDKAEVRVDARAKAPFDDAHRVLLETPLKKILTQIEKAGVVGNGGEVGVDLHLAIPITAENTAKEVVQATIEPHEVTVTSPDVHVRVDRVNGKVRLDTTTGKVTFDELHGELDGAPVKARGVVAYEPHIRFTGHVDTTVAPSLVQQIAAIDLTPHVTGRTPLSADVVVEESKGGTLVFDVAATSPLTGLALDVPAVVEKSAAATLPLQAQVKGRWPGDIRVAARAGKDLYLDFVRVRDGSLGARLAAVPVPNASPGRIAVDLPAVAGTVDATQINGVDGFRIRLARLHIPASPEPVPTTAKPATPAQPPQLSSLNARTFPPVDFRCDSFRIGPRDLHVVRLETHRIPEGLHVDRLAVDMGHLSLYNTTGTWTTDQSGHSRTNLNGRVFFRDGGSALRALAVYDDLTALQGDVGFQVSWPGAPVDATLATIDLDAVLDLKHGKLAKADNRFLKLAELLTLQLMDFYRSGADVRAAKGHLKFKAGKLTLDQMALALSSGDLVLKGDVDITKETLDLGVSMKLRITKTLNAVALGVLNPALALAYVALLGEETKGLDYFDRITQHSYRLTGTWDKPHVGKLDYTPLPIL